METAGGMVLMLAYLAGLLTLINPCVLPVLPIVLASSLREDRRAPLMLALGMSASFVALGLAIATLGPALGIGEDSVTRAASLLMVAFGLVLVVPQFGEAFSSVSAGFAARADARIGATSGSGLTGQLLGGALLGAVWSPCIGPTLGAAIGLAATGQDLGRAAAIMLAFSFGVSTLILGLAYGARSALQRHQAILRDLAKQSKPVMGALFLLVGTVLFFRLNHPVEAWLLSVMPDWLVDLSVSV